jgi:uncharacterized protein (TIGR03382 family)
MRKLLIPLSVLVLMAAGVSTAFAQNGISLGASAANSFVFTGTGGGDWTLGISASGTATGEGAWSPISGMYAINGSSIIGTLTYQCLTCVTPINTWDISGPAASFSIGTLLTGSLQLVDLSQTGRAGNFNYEGVANLDVTGGSDASLVGGIGKKIVVTLGITFPSGANLADLAKGATLGANIGSAVSPTPEPGSMALAGSGLLLLGWLVRRRRTAK